VFVCVGFCGKITAENTRFANMVVVGLLLGAAGDVLLNIRYLVKKNSQPVFMAGIAAFFAGHVMYLAAQLPYCEHIGIAAAAGAAVAGVLIAVMFKHTVAEPAFKAFGGVYVMTVVLMASVSIGSLFAAQNPCRVLFACGAFFFLVSDSILIFNTFGPKFSFPLGALTLVLYYIGQSLIALSVYYPV